MVERVLVIDDSKEIRDFLVEYVLEPKGFEVITASNGLMGLEIAVAERPDLMITDQQMPQLTGLEILAKLRERDIDIPAILMTGQGSEATAVSAFRLGISDYIIKPIDPEELSASIDNALRETRLQKEHDKLVGQLMTSNSQLQRRAQELNVLYEVGKSVSSSLDLEEVLQRVVEAAVLTVGAEEGSLMLLDEERSELYIRASKNVDSEARSVRRRVTDSLAGQVLQNKRAIAIGENSPIERTHTALLVKSLIYVPLVLENEAIGVLGVMNYLRPGTFEKDDTRTLALLAGYAAIAIKNANMFNEIERERNILSVMVNQNRDPILLVDEQNNILMINASAAALFQKSDVAVIGHPLVELTDHQDLIQFIGNGGDLLVREEEFADIEGRPFQGRLIKTDGGGRYVRLRRLQRD
ncbi:MAG: response regulator [Candidatus Promineifilaceae bacterium]